MKAGPFPSKSTSKLKTVYQQSADSAGAIYQVAVLAPVLARLLAVWKESGWFLKSLP